MNASPDISAKQLLSSGAWLLQKNIGEAAVRAQNILERGEFIRTKRRDGNVNSSLESTAEGAICVAKDISKRFSLDEPPTVIHHASHAFFGENLRRTIGALKVLIGR